MRSYIYEDIDIVFTSDECVNSSLSQSFGLGPDPGSVPVPQFNELPQDELSEDIEEVITNSTP